MNKVQNSIGITITLCVFLVFPIRSQDVSFFHLTTQQGLVSVNVRCILEDHQGFTWIGTEDGLHRYDGYTMTVYRNDPQNPNSISSNFIISLYEDSYHHLWIGSPNGGLSLYNRKKNTFTPIKNLVTDDEVTSGNYVRTIFESSDSTLYVGLDNGMICYVDLKNNTHLSNLEFNRIQIPDSKNPRQRNPVSAIIEDSEGNILIGVDGGGLSIFNPRTKSYSRHLEKIISEDIQSLYIDHAERLWVGTKSSGLTIYDPQSKRWNSLTTTSEPAALTHNQVGTILEDQAGNYWIATDNGISFIPSQQDIFKIKTIKHIIQNELDPESLLSNSVKTMYKDSNNRIWVGTYYGGINIYDKSARKFQHAKINSHGKGELINKNIFGFSEDALGNIWIGTDGGGLHCLRGGLKGFNKYGFKKINLSTSSPTEGLKIKCLEQDQNQHINVGTWGQGVFILDPIKGNTSHFSTKNGLSSDFITTIKADRHNNLWIGTWTGGLSILDQKTNTIKKYHTITNATSVRPHDKVSSILIDSKDRIWVALEVGGLTVLDTAKNQFKQVENRLIPNNMTILQIFEDSNGNLWLGTTQNGLILFDPTSHKTRKYDEYSGLANQVIYAIQEDKATGNIWVSTNNGLSVLDLTTQQWTNYSKSDGLQNNQFNPGSAATLQDGTMLFGGINGFNYFHPNKIKRDTLLPPLVFTNFWINNQESNVEHPESPLEENITLANQIDLSHDQNSFTIEFAALDYLSSEKIDYAYFLEGFHSEWQYIQKERKAIFTNLYPGLYTLHVKTALSGLDWPAEGKQITIRINPAWWQTVVFKTLVIFFTLAAAYTIFRVRVRYLLTTKEALKKTVWERTLELKNTNKQLTEKIEEIRIQNETLYTQKEQIIEKNNEIVVQNKELISQNEQINHQREELKKAQRALTNINEKLEKMVDIRTAKLKETIKKLDKTVFELDKFVYSASHDLSAPLKSILGLVSVAKIETDPARSHEYYNHIERSIQKLEDVIQNMVSYSRNSHAMVKSELILPHRIVNEIIKDLAFFEEAKKITFENLIHEELQIESDPGRLKIILFNLISNSMKYMDYKKVNPYISVSLKISENHFNFYVTDNGIGISKKDLPKIFDMFFRGSEQSEGSGLGLFIVKETIEKLDGTFDIKSKKNIGTTFSFNLPHLINTTDKKDNIALDMI